MWLAPTIVAAVFVTATISGMIGMAGGMILMALLVLMLPVAAAMIVHGVVQAVSNGSRAVFLRRHIVWSILPAYLAGAAVALAVFTAIVLVPDPALVLVVVGVFPWLARLVPKLGGLNVARPFTAALCGCVVTAAQLLAGASGPLLDVFYLSTPLTRHQVVASKALTQTIGHLIKLAYYAVVVGAAGVLPSWLFALAVVASILGTRLGTRLLDRFDDTDFRRVSGWVILTVATVCIGAGVQRL